MFDIPTPWKVQVSGAYWFVVTVCKGSPSHMVKTVDVLIIFSCTVLCSGGHSYNLLPCFISPLALSTWCSPDHIEASKPRCLLGESGMAKHWTCVTPYILRAPGTERDIAPRWISNVSTIYRKKSYSKTWRSWNLTILHFCERKYINQTHCRTQSFKEIGKYMFSISAIKIIRFQVNRDQGMPCPKTILRLLHL